MKLSVMAGGSLRHCWRNHGGKQAHAIARSMGWSWIREIEGSVKHAKQPCRAATVAQTVGLEELSSFEQGFLGHTDHV